MTKFKCNSSKKCYSDFTASLNSVSVFHQAWWMDAVCDRNWEVINLCDANGVVASLPFIKKKSRGLLLLTQPPLTQFLGPILKETHTSNFKRLSEQKMLLEELLYNLPKADIYRQNWSPRIFNLYPALFEGYSAKLRYTYRLDTSVSIEKMWDAFSGSTRRQIRKATKNNLSVKDDTSVEEFIQQNKEVYLRQGLAVPYGVNLIRSISEALITHHSLNLISVKDQQGISHASLFFINDQDSLYYLMGGTNPKYRNSGATSLCMFEGIKLAKQKQLVFDFEGSMIPNIEKFFRGFGGKPKEFYGITKGFNVRAKFALHAQNFLSDVQKK